MNEGATLRLVRGNNKAYDYTVANIPSGLTLAKMWFTVKTSLSDTWANAKIKKVIDPAGSADGQITDTGADGTGLGRFLLLPADTRSLVAGKRYIFDVQIKTNDGQLDTIERGTIEVVEEVTEVDA